MESFVLPSMAYVCMRVKRALIGELDGKLCVAIYDICVYEMKRALIEEFDGKLCIAIHGICVYVYVHL